MGIAFQILITGFRERGIPFHTIDIGSREETREAGFFSWGRFIEILRVLAKYFLILPSVENIYLTVGISRVGFLRDCFLLWPARLIRRRMVIHVHSGGYGEFYNTQPKWLQWLIVATLSQVDKIVVLGELLRAQFDFLPDHKDLLIVVPNSIPFDVEPEHVTGKTVSNPIRILYLSNMIKEKGYLTVLDTCRILHGRQVPIHCDFCGSFFHSRSSIGLTASEIRRNFFSKIEAAGLSGVVQYHGIVRDIKKEQFLRDAHLLILPSQFLWEGQPICILEAMAFGTPVIATHFRGIPEQISDGFNGFFIPANDPVAIADRVEQLWRDEEAYLKMSLNAMKYFQTYFTPKTHLDKLIPIILGESVDLKPITPRVV